MTSLFGFFSFGTNTLPPKESESFLELVWEALQDKTLIMLIVAAVVSLALGLHENPATGWIEGTAIIVAVALVVSVGATNDYQKVCRRLLLGSFFIIFPISFPFSFLDEHRRSNFGR